MALYKIVMFPKRGRGLRASQRIAANAIITRTPVVVVPKSEIKDTLAHYVFAWRGNLVALALGDASLLNHSDNANCDYAPDFAHKTIVVKSNRVINAGEELSVNYGWEPEATKHFVKINTKKKINASTLIERLTISAQQQTVANKTKGSAMSKISLANNPIFEHRHYESLGKWAAQHPHHIAEHLANHLANDNPKFNRKRFIEYTNKHRPNSAEVAANKRPQLRQLKGADDHKNTYGLFRRYVSNEDFSLFPQFQNDLDNLISEYKGEGLEALESNPGVRHNVPVDIAQPPELAPAMATARILNFALAKNR